jgi:D-3-phosphoglycerate dehydrogenase
MDASVLSRLPELKVISKYGVGLDMIDMAAMRATGKRLGWTGGVNRRSVSELVISFAIAMLRHVPEANREVRSGTWRQHTGGLLSGRTVGIVGCGHVGKDLVPLLKAFACRILANDILDFPAFYAAHGVEPASLDSLLARADIVTLHVPLDDTTRNLMGAAEFAMMKPTAVLINTCRGPVVNEGAVHDALKTNQIAMAGLDVMTEEPPKPENPLFVLSNVILTPHTAGPTVENWTDRFRNGFDNIVRVVDGRKPKWVIPELESLVK